MLKKRERLTKAAFDRSFACGRRSHAGPLTLIHDPEGPFHGAVVVGKKVAKKAVARNKIRRRIYSALYALKKELSLTGTFIVLSKPPVATLPYSELKQTLAELVGRTKKQNPTAN